MLLVPSVEVTKGEPQPPFPVHTPPQMTMAGGLAAVMRKAGEVVAVGAESDIGALFGPIGDSCLEDSAAGNLS